jgi:hypothetical protein
MPNKNKDVMVRTPSMMRRTPKTTNAAAAPILMARSGSRVLSSRPAPIASASAATMPMVDPAQTPTRSMSPGLSAASVTVASMVLSPSSARKNAPPTARIADLRVAAARRSSSSVSSSPRRVHAAKPRKATPARIEIGPVGSTAPSAAPSSTLARWTSAVAAVIPASTGSARNRVAKVSAMSWLLSPSSATKITARLTRNAVTAQLLRVPHVLLVQGPQVRAGRRRGRAR